MSLSWPVEVKRAFLKIHHELYPNRSTSNKGILNMCRPLGDTLFPRPPPKDCIFWGRLQSISNNNMKDQVFLGIP